MPKVWQAVLAGVSIGVVVSMILAAVVMRHVLLPGRVLGIMVLVLWVLGFLFVGRLVPDWRKAQSSPAAFTAQFIRFAKVLGTLCLVSGLAGVGFGVLTGRQLFVIPGVGAMCFGGFFLLIAKKA